VAQAELEGICARATHVITGLTTGAFEFYAGASAEVGAGVDVAGVGAGARSGAKRELINRDGDPEACALTTSDDTQPPDGCGAALRVEVAPLGATSQTAVVAVGGANDPVAGGAPQTLVVPRQGGAIPPGPGIVKLHIDSPDPRVQLFGTDVDKLVQQPDGNFRSVGPSTILCRAPCDEYIDARKGQQVHLASPDMPPSDSFHLYANAGDVNVRVEPGNSALYTTGGWLGTLGVLGVITGGVVLLVGGIDKSGGDGDKADDILLGGGVTLGASAAVLGAGIGMTLGGETDIEITPPAGDMPLPLSQ
jgi:hypothetical protein